VPETAPKCCMCQVADDKVRILKCQTPIHPHCLQGAALSQLIKLLGWDKEEKD
jgi:hypothetical protein